MDHAEREREAAEERLAKAERERQRALDHERRARDVDPDAEDDGRDRGGASHRADPSRDASEEGGPPRDALEARYRRASE